MDRTRVAFLIGAYALLAWFAYRLQSFGGPSCLGLDATPCYEQWLASRPWFERMWDSPIPYVVVFLLASALTVWWERRSARRRAEADQEY